MPLFVVAELLKKISPVNKEHKSRKEILSDMRYNKKHRGWV